MRYLNKSVLLIFAILASLLLFSCAAPASGIDAYGDGGDVSVKQVPVGGSPFMGGGAGAGAGGGGRAPGTVTPTPSSTAPGGLTYSGSNSSSNSNGFYSEGLSSLGWTSLELDITANGTTTHHSVNPGNSIVFENLAPGSTVTVTGKAVLPDGTVRNVKSDTYTVKKGENKLKLYCEYKYWLNGCKDSSLNGGPHTYMSNQSITLPVASPAAGTYPFAGWIEYAPGLSTHGNYYRKGSNVPAGQVTGDVEFFADYGFALYKDAAGGGKTYIDSSTGLSIATGQLVELKAEDIDGNTSGIITGVTITSGAGNVTMESGKIKGVSAGTATVTYTGTTKYGAPFSVSVPVTVTQGPIPVKLTITGPSQLTANTDTFTFALTQDPSGALPAGNYVWTIGHGADTSTSVSSATVIDSDSTTTASRTLTLAQLGLESYFSGDITATCTYTPTGGVASAPATDTKAVTGATNIAAIIKLIQDNHYDGRTVTGAMTSSDWTDLKAALTSNTQAPFALNLSGTTCTSVPSSAFKDIACISELRLPNTVTSIGQSAFQGCTNLASLTLSNALTSIGQSAFEDCTSLAGSLTFPNTVTSIGVRAFRGCTSITSCSLPPNVTTVAQMAFSGCTNLASVTIPSGVTRIENSAFYNCSRLASVTIPSNVSIIEAAAFYGCESLTNITVPASVTTMQRTAFEGCTGLTNVDMLANVRSIPESTFKGCSSLTTIRISASVGSISGATSVELNAFSDCNNLSSVTYDGTCAGWSQLVYELALGNNALKKSGLVVHCSDGDY